jgi:acylphosphatase
VRNLPDGDVEVMAEGKIADLADFREWLDEGPPGAWVQSVTAERLQATGHYSDFFVE